MAGFFDRRGPDSSVTQVCTSLKLFACMRSGLWTCLQLVRLGYVVPTWGNNHPVYGGVGKCVCNIVFWCFNQLCPSLSVLYYWRLRFDGFVKSMEAYLPVPSPGKSFKLRQTPWYRANLAQRPPLYEYKINVSLKALPRHNESASSLSLLTPVSRVVDRDESSVVFSFLLFQSCYSFTTPLSRRTRETFPTFSPPEEWMRGGGGKGGGGISWTTCPSWDVGKNGKKLCLDLWRLRR